MAAAFPPPWSSPHGDGRMVTRVRGRAVTIYRFFPIGKGGHIAGAPELVDCPSDETAIAEAKRRSKTHAVEIWDMDRQVARVEPGAS